MVGVFYPHPLLPFRKDAVPKVITGTQHIHDSFAANAVLLGAPPIALPVLQGQITDLVAAHQAMKAVKGLGPARAVKLETLWGTVGSYQLHVDQLCSAHPEQAAVYIAASGFRPSERPVRNDVPLMVDPTNVPGQVILTIHSYLLETPGNRRTARRTHLLRHTLDGETYVIDEATSNARALVSGLPALVPIGFEVAAKDASGVSAWCPTVTIVLTK